MPLRNKAAKSGSSPASCSVFLLPISQEPRPGQRVMVRLKNGKTRECTATLMVTDQGQYTQYFHRRRAIDINQIAGWTNAPNAQDQPRRNRLHRAKRTQSGFGVGSIVLFAFFSISATSAPARTNDGTTGNVVPWSAESLPLGSTGFMPGSKLQWRRPSLLAPWVGIFLANVKSEPRHE